jgi:arylsulfatase A-like enzyme
MAPRRKASLGRTLLIAVTMPEHFKRNGYLAESLGKVFHRGFEDQRSWSVPIWYPEASRLGDLADPPGYGPSWHAAEVDDEALADGKTAAQAVAELKRLRGRSFFLAVGFGKPHLPFVAPRRYYDLYPPESVPLAENPLPPSDVPEAALTDSAELRHYSDIPKTGAIGESKARELVRGYLASVSYLDAQIGRVLQALDLLGLRERTIVILWGDHGFHLGEHGIWGKSTNFEVAARSPLIVSAPRLPAAGVHIQALVELVDVFPSVAELAGIPAPAGVEGTSFVPLLADPRRSWKSAAFTQHPRGGLMGRSVRTGRYRYTDALASDGRRFVLSEQTGLCTVVYFFPRAFTVGCTTEAEHFRDNRVADRGLSSFQGRPVDTDISTFYGNPSDSTVNARVDATSATIDQKEATLSRKP